MTNQAITKPTWWVWGIAFLLGSSLAGCKFFEESELESFGLSVVAIDIDSEDLGKLNSTVTIKTGVPAEITVEGRDFDAQIHYAGKSTLDHYKKSYDVIFPEGGYGGRRTLRLSAQAADPTGLRSLVGFRVYQKHGLISPTAKPVVLYVNRQYKGLYFQIDNVTPSFVRRHYGKSSHLYKATDGNATLALDILSRMPEAFNIDSEPETYAPLKGLIRSIHKRGDAPPLNEILDKDDALRYFSANALLHSWDAYRNNYFLYLSKEDHKFRFIPWDLDKAYNWDENVHPFASGAKRMGNALFTRLMKEPNSRERYRELLAELVYDTFPKESMLTLVRTQADRIAEAYRHDRVLSAGDKSLQEQTEALTSRISQWYDKLQENLDEPTD